MITIFNVIIPNIYIIITIIHIPSAYLQHWSPTKLMTNTSSLWSSEHWQHLMGPRMTAQMNTGSVQITLTVPVFTSCVVPMRWGTLFNRNFIPVFDTCHNIGSLSTIYCTCTILNPHCHHSMQIYNLLTFFIRNDMIQIYIGTYTYVSQKVSVAKLKVLGSP